MKSEVLTALRNVLGCEGYCDLVHAISGDPTVSIEKYFQNIADNFRNFLPDCNVSRCVDCSVLRVETLEKYGEENIMPGAIIVYFKDLNDCNELFLVKPSIEVELSFQPRLQLKTRKFLQAGSNVELWKPLK
jgi:hypothetical protein